MQSLNILDYGADSTGVIDSWEPIQRAVDDAGRIGRAFNASGDTDRNIVMLATDDDWYGFSSEDENKPIVIEANLGLQPEQYFLLIDEVISSTQCTVKSYNNAPLTFVNGFSGVRVMWQRGGTFGKQIAAPSGKYRLDKPVEVLGSLVGIIGEGSNAYSEDGTSFRFAGFGPGFIEQPLIGKDTYWMERGPAIIEEGIGSYHLHGAPRVFCDFNDIPHVQTSLKYSTAFTVEFYVKPNNVDPNGFQILSCAGSLPGGTVETAFSFEIDTNGKWTCRVTLDDTVYICQCPTLPTINALYHLALQFDGSNLGLFVNGSYYSGGTSLNGKALHTRPYQLFNWGAYRTGWPGGGAQLDAVDCYVSHLRVSNSARYSISGFTPDFGVPSLDINTLLLDEADPSQELLFLISLGGFNNLNFTAARSDTIKYGGGGWGFLSGHAFRDFSVHSSGVPLWQRQTIESSYRNLGLQTNGVALYTAGDTFNVRFREIRLAGRRAGIVSSGPAGICRYDDFVVTSGECNWLSAGSGTLSNWYLHGPSMYQLVFDLWEGDARLDFSNEDVTNPDFKANMVIGRDSDVTITATKMETYAQPVPSVIIIAPRSATIINGMFEPHAEATEAIHFVSAPKSKVVLINPNHGRWTGSSPQGDVPWSISAPSGKLEVIP